MKIKSTEPYLWLPVDAKEEKVLLHLYSEGEKIDEIAIRLGVTDCDYYASVSYTHLRACIQYRLCLRPTGQSDRETPKSASV